VAVGLAVHALTAHAPPPLPIGDGPIFAALDGSSREMRGNARQPSGRPARTCAASGDDKGCIQRLPRVLGAARHHGVARTSGAFSGRLVLARVRGCSAALATAFSTQPIVGTASGDGQHRLMPRYPAPVDGPNVQAEFVPSHANFGKIRIAGKRTHPAALDG
jgi:hypothetical protein